MDQIYPDEGLIPALVAQVTGQSAGSLTWDLFTAPAGPATLADTWAGLTLCSTAGQFAAIAVAIASFTLQQVAAHVGTIQAPSIVFTNISGGPVTVTGYAIYDPSLNVLEGEAFFDAPITVPAGGTVTVIPILGTFSGLTS